MLLEAGEREQRDPSGEEQSDKWSGIQFMALIFCCIEKVNCRGFVTLERDLVASGQVYVILLHTLESLRFWEKSHMDGRCPSLPPPQAMFIYNFLS